MTQFHDNVTCPLRQFDNLSTLPVGEHSLVVTYAGDASFAASNSTGPPATPINFAVEKAPTQVTLNFTAVAVPPGTPVPLTAMVWTYDLPSIDGNIAVQVTSPNGTVTLPAAPLSYSTLYGEPVATVTIPASDLVTGPNAVSVTYAGNTNLLASAAATATIQVKPANTSLTITGRLLRRVQAKRCPSRQRWTGRR